MFRTTHFTCTKICGGDAMGKNDGDAYPDPRKRSGRCRTRTLVCIGLLLICFGGFITAVCAPGDALPDPRSVPRPIFNDHANGKLTENPVMRTQSILIVE